MTSANTVEITPRIVESVGFFAAQWALYKLAAETGVLNVVFEQANKLLDKVLPDASPNLIPIASALLATLIDSSYGRVVEQTVLRSMSPAETEDTPSKEQEIFAKMVRYGGEVVASIGAINLVSWMANQALAIV